MSKTTIIAESPVSPLLARPARRHPKNLPLKGEGAYLYRAVDSAGNTLECVFSPHRHAQAAEYFFRKAHGGAHTVLPRVINVDGNAAYAPAIAALQQEGTLAPECQLRPVKYLNNVIEQDHRFSKRRVQILVVPAGLADLTGLRSFDLPR